jgi:hypothetical protein
MPGFQCVTCGQFHEHLPMCLGPSAPALWDTIPPEERESRAELSSDQCIIDDKHFFILGRLVIPVTDGPDPFIWLAWVSLSASNFARMRELWTTEGRETEPPYFGWFQSALPYPVTTLNLKASVQTMACGERPLISIEPGTHLLATEQQLGISIARVREIAEIALHGAPGPQDGAA